MENEGQRLIVLHTMEYGHVAIYVFWSDLDVLSWCSWLLKKARSVEEHIRRSALLRDSIESRQYLITEPVKLCSLLNGRFIGRAEVLPSRHYRTGTAS